MQTNRALVRLAIGALGLGAALAASPAMAQVRLDFWTEFSSPPALPTIEKIVSEFNAANPDIQVVHTGFENTPYETTLKTSFAGGNPADIVEINGGSNMYQYAEAGGLVDLTDFVTTLKDKIKPGLEPIYEYGGKYYGIPLEVNVGNLLWYNADMLKEKGIDPAQLNTWSGFVAAAQTFKDAGIDPIAFGDSEGWPGNHIFNHITRRLLTTDEYVRIAARTVDPSVTSELKWSDPKLVEAWKLYSELNDKKLFTAGSLSDDYPTAANLFVTGKAPFMTMGGWLLGQIEQTNPKLNFGVIGFPAVDGAPGKQTELVTSGLVVTITKASKHPEEAKRFLDYLASEPVQREYMEANQVHTPYVYDTSSWAYGEGFKKISALVSASTNSAPFLDMIEDQSCNVPWVWTVSQGILSGDITPDDAGAGHEECVVDLRKKNGWN
jgi:raffinose/stachyose/melibiose transport system substrate-binding protein